MMNRVCVSIHMEICHITEIIRLIFIPSLFRAKTKDGCIGWNGERGENGRPLGESDKRQFCFFFDLIAYDRLWGPYSISVFSYLLKSPSFPMYLCVFNQ